MQHIKKKKNNFCFAYTDESHCSNSLEATSAKICKGEEVGGEEGPGAAGEVGATVANSWSNTTGSRANWSSEGSLNMVNRSSVWFEGPLVGWLAGGLEGGSK